MLIDFKILFPKYNINPKGVLHVGASEGQETEAYILLGVKNICYVEAIPSIYRKLIDHVKKFDARFILINACISDVDGQEMVFNIANNGGQSSSLFEFGTHTKEHPSVKFIDRVKFKTSRLANLAAIDWGVYDFLNLDLQGAELMALKSIHLNLHEFKWVYIEVNKKPLYKGCPLVGEVEEYMKAFSFLPVETKWTDHGWGDCLFINKRLVK